MPAAAEDEDPLPSAYTSEEVTGRDDHAHKCTAESMKEAQKQIRIMHLLKPIWKNPEEHPTSSDIEQEVTIGMAYDAETLKTELVKDESPA